MHALRVGDSGEAWRLGRRPALDGLRGVAILLVLVCHLFSVETGAYDQFHAVGSAGVEIFFALSGFLITALLIEERTAAGSVSMPGFYARRARRLFPALAVVVAAMVVIQAVVGVDLVPNVWTVVLYSANWAQVDGANLGVLNHAWSLAIEEQFYLIWPVVLVVSARWKNGPLVCVLAGVAASTALRFTVADGSRAYLGSDTQAGALLMGALLAILAVRGLRGWRVRPIIPALLSVSCAASMCTSERWVGDRLVPTVVPVVTTAAIWLACHSPAGPLEWRWLRYVGQRSYGIYLWHMPMLWLVWLAKPSVLWGLVALGVTIGVAEVSWRSVEHPVLNAHHRGGGVQRRVGRVGHDVPEHLCRFAGEQLGCQVERLRVAVGGTSDAREPMDRLPR